MAIYGDPIGGQNGVKKADTLDGKHADEFASANDVRDLMSLVGDSSVSSQISVAIQNAIPVVSTDDNGAFLRVVDGQWSVASLTNIEEVTF